MSQSPPPKEPHSEDKTKSVQGTNNRSIQGDDNQAVQGNNNWVEQIIIKTLNLRLPEKPKRDKTQQILLDWVEHEVESRLTHSLHNRILIQLEKEEDPTQVIPFWSDKIKIRTGKPYRLPSDTTVIDIYDRKDINGRLLILGPPGSGKTTTMLQLAKDLVVRAQKDREQPIPVLLNLSSWKDDEQSIADWMVDNLKFVYGLRKDIGQQFLSQGILLPLLDGLDELASNRQSLCVEKLNAFLKAEGALHPLVVCSRTEEYQLYTKDLMLNGSIILQLLNREQIQDFIFRTEGKGFWDCIENDEQILDIAQTPLFLNILVISCSDISFEKWKRLESSEKRITYLFETYIHKRIIGNRKINFSNLYKYLGCLSSELIQANQTDFFIENLQPYWLKNKNKLFIYKLVFHLLFGLIYGLGFGLISELIFKFKGAIWVWLIVGLIRGIITVLFDTYEIRRINPIETLSFSLTNFKQSLILILIIGLIGGLISIFITGVVGLFLALTIVIIFGTIAGIISGLSGPQISKKIYPNQGIKESVKNAIILSVITTTIAIIILIFLEPIIEKIIVTYNSDFSFDILSRTVLPFISIFSIWLSALPIIQHFSLRLVLWFYGHIPWNYAKFLNYATDRMFLQRVGGGYRFIHRLLKEHFARTYWKSEGTRYSDNALDYNNRGLTRFFLGDYQGAIDDYTQAVKLSPNFAIAYTRRGSIYLMQEKKQEAIDDYQKAASLYQQQGNTELYQMTLYQIFILQFGQ